MAREGVENEGSELPWGLRLITLLTGEEGER